MTAQPAISPSKPLLRMTEQAFLAGYADERPSCEFADGEVTQKPMTKRTHMLVAGQLAAILREYRQLNGGLAGEDPTVDVSDPDARRYMAPDVAYWAPGKPTGEEVLLPPTLAVEIQSPGQALGALRAKCRDYRRHGVDVAWLVIPTRRQVEVHDARHDGVAIGVPGTVASDALPGLRIDLAQLFAVLDR